MLSNVIGPQGVRTRIDPNPTLEAVAVRLYLYSSLLRRPVPGCPTKCELSFGEEARGRAGSGLHPTLCHTCALLYTCWPLLHACAQLLSGCPVVNAPRCVSLQMNSFARAA